MEKKNQNAQTNSGPIECCYYMYKVLNEELNVHVHAHSLPQDQDSNYSTCIYLGLVKCENYFFYHCKSINVYIPLRYNTCSWKLSTNSP